MKLLSRLPKKKAHGEDQISNTALRLLPKNMILAFNMVIYIKYINVMFSDDALSV